MQQEAQRTPEQVFLRGVFSLPSLERGPSNLILANTDPKGGTCGTGTEQDRLIIWSEALGRVGNHTFSKPD